MSASPLSRSSGFAFDPRLPLIETTPAASLSARVLRAVLDLGLAYLPYSGLQVDCAIDLPEKTVGRFEMVVRNRDRIARIESSETEWSLARISCLPVG